MDLDALWQDCLNSIEKNHLIENEILFNSLIKQTSLVDINDNVATLTTDMEFNIPDILSCKNQIESVLSTAISKQTTINILSVAQYEKNKKSNNVEIKEDNLNNEMTFDDFIIGSCNRIAQNAALAVSTHPGDKFNPLFIYSNPGLGKTHLLNAIGNYSKKINPDKKVVYVSSKVFVDDIINAMKSNHSDDVYKDYTNVDILLIDDIQFLASKEKSSEIFFHIFNDLINHNKQIVITSDKKPDELEGLEERLISRFNSGLSFGIDPPEFETAKAILLKKIEKLNNDSFIVQEEVVDYIAINFSKDVRSLEGIINQLLFYSLVDPVDVIDLEYALKVLKDEEIVKNPSNQLTKEYILKTTADMYYISVDQLISKNRTKSLTTPREICMYIMREKLDLTFNDIGVIFSNRDHSTIMKAHDRVKQKLEKDDAYKSALKQLNKALKLR